jgi:sporulation protein YlmC with PRC-barrel domain
MLADLLKSISFVESVEVSEEDEKLSDVEISMVEERWTEYKKNPGSVIPWDNVKNKIRKKHGL